VEPVEAERVVLDGQDLQPADPGLLGVPLQVEVPPVVASPTMRAVPELVTERLLLRHWWFEDIEPLATIYAHPEVERMLVPTTREETESQVAYIAAHWEHEGFGAWAVEDRSDGRFLGRIGFFRHVDFTPEPGLVEIGWTLDTAVWGKGLATEGARAALAFGFERFGFERVISITRPENAASRRVMEKLGLTYQGATFWRDLDHVWYAIDRDPGSS